MWIVYDLIFLIIILIYLPVYLFRRKFHKRFLSRLGFLPADLKLNNPIWIHAVSVGEVIALKSLINGLRKGYPGKGLVISTVTPTGNKIAKSIAIDNDLVIYFPLDFSFVVKRVIKKINPCMVIIAETEIWPNFISCLYNRRIPVVVVNSRISDKSFKGYMSVRLLLAKILNKINLFCCQTDTDAQRLISLGVSKDKIKVTGNMKFDNTDYADFKKSPLPPFSKEGFRGDLQMKIGLQINDKLWVAASTHPNEEEIILSVYKRLLVDYPHLKLLIAPRHPERTKEIEKLISKYNFHPFCISQITPEPRTQTPGSIFILDTIGQLMNFYKIADIVFVGGSFIKKGGHNILEPAVLAKPVIFGPYMFNFRDIADLFIKHKAAILAHNKHDLEKTIRDLLSNPQFADELGKKAKVLVETNRGATGKTVEYIESMLTACKT